MNTSYLHANSNSVYSRTSIRVTTLKRYDTKIREFIEGEETQAGSIVSAKLEGPYLQSPKLLWGMIVAFFNNYLPDFYILSKLHTIVWLTRALIQVLTFSFFVSIASFTSLFVE